MQTILITGGNSGIGKELARAFLKLGKQVIITGRNEEKLKQVASENPKLSYEVMDVSNFDSVSACFKRVERSHPELDTVINNAGIQKLINFEKENITKADLDDEIDINLKGLIYVSSIFLPLLKKQPQAKLIQISSGLAFVPLTKAPIYSATKSAVHSFTVSLRHQLINTNVKVVEIIPPMVKIELHRNQTRQPHRAMELTNFIAETMKSINSEKLEIPIGVAKVLRTGSRFAPKLFFKIINK